jgi:hypothetical protein
VTTLLLSITAFAQKPVATLPAGITCNSTFSVCTGTVFDTTYSLPVGGTTWAAHTASDLTNALTNSVPGDVIVLDAGVTYSGNFHLPAKSNPGNKWIYITSSSYASLPAPGTRVAPTDAVNMPRITSPNGGIALTIDPGGNYYRFVGIEMTSTSNYCPNGRCLSSYMIWPAMTPATAPNSYIVVDRCYVHGAPTIDIKHAIAANADHFAVIDSYISDIHAPRSDAQAVGEWYSPGPIKIVNNFLEAAGENIMFGGAGGPSNPFHPQNIEVQNNWLYKPLAWDAVGISIPPGNYMVVKNHFEIKSAQYVFFNNNILENVWVSGQTGFSIGLGPRSSDSGNGAVVDDVVVANNIMKNVSSGIDTLESDNLCLPPACTNPGEAKRVILYNNLIFLGDMTQPGYQYPQAYGFGSLLNGNLTDWVYQHNTVIGPPNMTTGACRGGFQFNVPGPNQPPVGKTTNVWIQDNVLCRVIGGSAGFIGQFSYALIDYLGNPGNPAQLFGNVFYRGTDPTSWAVPADNTVSIPAITYVNPPIDYTLATPAWTDTSDGKIAGVDNSTLP